MIIATFSFERGGEDVLRKSSIAPTGNANKFSITGIVNENTGQPELNWSEINSGDGDNNSLVTLSDLTPLGISLNMLNVAAGTQADKGGL